MILGLLIVNCCCAAILLSSVWWWAREAPLEAPSKAERMKVRRTRRAWAARCTLPAPLWGPLLGALVAILLLGIFAIRSLINSVVKLWNDAHLPIDPLPDDGPGQMMRKWRIK